MKIVAIDFETANYNPLSACALGLAIFEDHQLVESPYWLIKPPKGHGWFIEEWTEDIHGIGWFDVCKKPEFAKIAQEVVIYLAAADLVVERTMHPLTCACCTPCWSISRSPRHPSSTNAPWHSPAKPGPISPTTN